MSNAVVDPTLPFDESKLTNLDTLEKKDLLLFQWLSNLEKELLQKPITAQKQIETVLLKYVQYVNPHPNRPTRTLIGRCFTIVYTKGDVRTLFDTISQMQTILLNKTLDPFVKL
jgi:HEAT repeat-containing protein 5